MASRYALPCLQAQHDTTTAHPYGSKIKAERVGQSAVTSSISRPIPDNLSPLHLSFILYITKINYFPPSFHTHKEPNYHSLRHHDSTNQHIPIYPHDTTNQINPTHPHESTNQINNTSSRVNQSNQYNTPSWLKPIKIISTCMQPIRSLQHITVQPIKIIPTYSDYATNQITPSYHDTTNHFHSNISKLGAVVCERILDLTAQGKCSTPSSTAGKKSPTCVLPWTKQEHKNTVVQFKRGRRRITSSVVSIKRIWS